MPVSHRNYYDTWHGHEPVYLQEVLQVLKEKHSSIIYLAGDSSLDNKYWILDKSVPAVNGYEDVLQPPVAVPDVSHHLNAILAENPIQLNRRSTRSTSNGTSHSIGAINTAVEATTLGSRVGKSGSLWPSDEFIRDNITENDILVVSVGGNDIALSPSCSTICNILGLVACRSKSAIKNGHPCCLYHFENLFGTRVKEYIEKITTRAKPKAVVICMNEKTTGSWADMSLSCLGYNRDPEKLQLAIRRIFELATKKIQIDGTQVIPVPLFESLDPRDSSDYVQRVEPSASGGRKMAVDILTALNLV